VRSRSPDTLTSTAGPLPAAQAAASSPTGAAADAAAGNASAAASRGKMIRFMPISLWARAKAGDRRRSAGHAAARPSCKAAPKDKRERGEKKVIVRQRRRKDPQAGRARPGCAAAKADT